MHMSWNTWTNKLILLSTWLYCCSLAFLCHVLVIMSLSDLCYQLSNMSCGIMIHPIHQYRHGCNLFFFSIQSTCVNYHAEVCGTWWGSVVYLGMHAGYLLKVTFKFKACLGDSIRLSSIAYFTCAFLLVQAHVSPNTQEHELWFLYLMVNNYHYFMRNCRFCGPTAHLCQIMSCHQSFKQPH